MCSKILHSSPRLICSTVPSVPLSHTHIALKTYNTIADAQQHGLCLSFTSALELSAMVEVARPCCASEIRLGCAGQSRGFGFVHMDNAESASNAAAGMNGKPMDGRPLVVRLRSEGPDKRGGGGFDRPRGGGFGPMENDESKVHSSPALGCLSGARHVVIVNACRWVCICGHSEMPCKLR